MRVQARLACVAAVAGALTVPLAAPAAADAAYGAIAINRYTGAWGISHSYGTLTGARRRAHRECRGSCKVLVWVRNRCGAVVQTPTRFVAGVGSTRKRAYRHAKRRAGTSRVRRVAWVCSG